jgi:[ribosomal protein S18]-alanine N-acetyltransferase
VSAAEGLICRPMRWRDLSAAQALESLLFPDDAWTPEQFWSELAEVPASRYYLVAESDGEVVGYAGLATAGGDADVQTVGVAPGWQRRGAGRALVAALLDEAARRGCERAFLEVRADNAAAIALYARFGFERVGVRRGYYQRAGVDGVLMRLTGLRRRVAASGPG